LHVVEEVDERLEPHESGTAMILESDLIARVETYIRHPVFAGSDVVMEGVLDDLQSRAESRQISPETFSRLRDLILGSPHFRLN